MANINLDALGAEIALALEQYTEDVTEALEAELDRTSKAVLQEIKDTSPSGTGKYKSGWVRKKETGNGIKYTIHNKKRGSIAHLLEFGHAKRGGGRVEGKPHMRPAYDKFVPDMQERIEQIIRNGGV